MLRVRLVPSRLETYASRGWRTLTPITGVLTMLGLLLALLAAAFGAPQARAHARVRSTSDAARRPSSGHARTRRAHWQHVRRHRFVRKHRFKRWHSVHRARRQSTSHRWHRRGPSCALSARRAHHHHHHHRSQRLKHSHAAKRGRHRAHSVRRWRWHSRGQHCSWSPSQTVTYESGPPPPPALAFPATLTAPRATSEPIGEMEVALDAGGWGSSAFGDIAGAAKYVRLQSRFATDSEVGGAAAAGVRVGSWLFGAAGGNIAAINPATMAAEVVAVFKRYGRGGSFWAGRPDLGATNVELLNEPANPYFWSDAGDVASYAALSRVVHAALEANFPPATRPRLLLSFDGGYGHSEFGKAVLAAGGAADGVTVHPYGGTENVTESAEGRRQLVVEAHEDTGLPVYVTEVGWPTAVGQSPTGDSLQWTEQQQAANITSFVRWARGTGFVALVVYFNYVDYGTNTLYGIERSDRSHKLAYAALAGA
jgi:hypothetical protein